MTSVSLLPPLPLSTTSSSDIAPEVAYSSHSSISPSSLNHPTSQPASPLPAQPPAYQSITGSSTSALSATGLGPEEQAARNREKQAIRDHQRAQDALIARLHSPTLSSQQGLTSIEPSVTAGSQSTVGAEGAGPVVPLSVPVASSSSLDTRNQQSKIGAGSSDSGSSGALGHRGLLPPGMDVQEALQKCEDPTLGWSLQFWVTIADPVTQHVFFANPASGQCSWEPPIGAFVVPRSAEGEWWELADASRGNRSYYYNTLSGKTQWTRPGGEAFVIPLGLIQNNSLPKRANGPVTSHASFLAAPQHSPSRSLPPSPRTPRTPKNNSPHSFRPKRNPLTEISPSSPSNGDTLKSTSTKADPPTPSTRFEKQSSHLISTLPALQERPLSEVSTFPSDPTSLTTVSTNLATPNASIIKPEPPTSPPKSLGGAVEGSSGSDADTKSDAASWWERRKSKAAGKWSVVSKKAPNMPVVVSSAAYSDQNSVPSVPPLPQENINGQNSSEAPALPDLSDDLAQEPLFVEPSVKTKRFSTGLHPLLPPDILNDISAFQTSNFASKYFATKRSGLLRSRVPLVRILQHQTSPITSPLLMIPKILHKDAVIMFKVIQHVMGERDRAVEGATGGLGGRNGAMSGSSSALSMVALGKGRKGDEGDVRRGGRMANGFSHGGHGLNSVDENERNGYEVNEKSDKFVVLEEVRWLVQMAVTNSEMRDEVYAQLIKQLTKNPDHEAVVLGFQLFCVFVLAFGPSKEFTEFVRNFLKLHRDRTDDGIGVMAKYCLAKLEIMANKGGRGKALTIGEIEHASDAAFYPSIYGESLETIMSLQERSYPDLKIPIVLPFLADGILALGGMESEGIFRVPGDNDSVFELKSRIDRGHYQLNGIDDPHVAASLFKLWLRELEHPLIPQEMYNDALAASRGADDCVAFLKRLPTYNRRVLIFVTSFIQMLLKDEVVAVTKMTAQNLALVLAPNVLRTTSDSLVTVFTNSTFESKFILQLLLHLKPDTVDPEYVPMHGQAVGRESIDTA